MQAAAGAQDVGADDVLGQAHLVGGFLDTETGFQVRQHQSLILG